LNPALVFTPLLLFGLLLLFVLPVLLKLLKTCKVEEISPEWLENFSCSSYHAMVGLLSDEDFDFLSRQPGFDVSLYRKFRRDRLNIFKQYLNRLIIDFDRLHVAARFLLSQSSEDRSDLVSHLVWLRVRFGAAVIQAQISYGLCVLGFRCLAIKAAIRHLEEMSAQLSAIPSPQSI